MNILTKSSDPDPSVGTPPSIYESRSPDGDGHEKGAVVGGETSAPARPTTEAMNAGTGLEGHAGKPRAAEPPLPATSDVSASAVEALGTAAGSEPADSHTKAVGTPQQLCDICEEPLGDATTACPHCGTKFAVGTPPSADDQTNVEQIQDDWRKVGPLLTTVDLSLEMRQGDYVQAVWRKVPKLLDELTCLRAELNELKRERDEECQRNDRTNGKLIDAEIVLRERLDAAKAQYTALLIDLRAIVEQWKQEVEKANDEPVKYFGTLMDPDGYCQFDAVFERCINELSARLSGEPH